jgi:hypothetical protein
MAPSVCDEAILMCITCRRLLATCSDPLMLGGQVFPLPFLFLLNLVTGLGGTQRIK